MPQPNETEPLKVFWQPGCTSCLRAKEFLNRHGIDYRSINVMADPEGFEDLARLGLKTVPIVSRGVDWVNGQVLRDVARIAGIRLGDQDQLPPAEMVRRTTRTLAAAQRFAAQIPEEKLDTRLPNRPQTYRQLAGHVFQVAEAFLDQVEHGKRLDAYVRGLPPGVSTRDDVVRFGAAMERRLLDWWSRKGEDTDFTTAADVYYGTQSLHDFLERTTWHSTQHTRQLQRILEQLGIAPEGPLDPADFAGLPMPENVWDDTTDAARLDDGAAAAPIGWGTPAR